MVVLVKKLAQRYYVGAMSNLDQQNGDMYIENDYFSIFNHDLFLSYQIKKLKPSKEFFNEVVSKLNVKPYQILLIDDHESNIEQAKGLKIETIKFSISEGTQILENRLKSHQIVY